MLVLTRKNDEQIRIADDITVTILRIKGNTVRLGIEAPADVRILRGELPDHQGANSTETESMVIIEGTIDVPILNADENPGGFVSRETENADTGTPSEYRSPLSNFRGNHRKANQIVEKKLATQTGRPELPLSDRISIPFSTSPSQPR